MGEATLWGLAAGSSLVLGALVTFWAHPRQRIIGWVMAFGAGALISAIAYELVLEAIHSGENGLAALGLAAGALTFFVGDWLIERVGGAGRKSSAGTQAGGAAIAIVLGTLLDGIPESFLLGSSVVGGEVSVAFLAAVFLTNLPESMAASSGLHKAGWPRQNILRMWLLIAACTGLAAALGYAAFVRFPERSGVFVQAFAAGAMLVMLADTMMPEAFEYGGKLVGLLTVLGFGLAVGLTLLEV